MVIKLLYQSKLKKLIIGVIKVYFENFQYVSEFFENDAVDYAPNKNKFDGLELKTFDWKLSLLEVAKLTSSFLRMKIY
jgi:hypothetical protein